MTFVPEDKHTPEEIETAIDVLESTREQFDLDSDEFADISQTLHYIR